jgi:oxygen-independent coproporphyrinogen-3 oxidase
MFGLYVQVPFCEAKCTYCNFPTRVAPRTLFNPYLEAVCREVRECDVLYRQAGIEEWNVAGPIEADTLYVGGGSPALLDAEQLERLIEVLRRQFRLRIVEATLEVNPQTVTVEAAQAWRRLGFDRISLGVQSFNDRELAAVGRRHRARDVGVATERLRAAGFTNLSYDLIIGLPYQTEQSWETSLAGALALRPEHISVYLLEVDEHSRLGREVLSGGCRYSAQALPAEEAMAEWYEWARYRLEQAGYQQYEISNWALPGFVSRHNLKYWLRMPYLGFGAGAHSFAGGQRWANCEDPHRYIELIQSGRPAVQFVEQLGETEVLEEELLLGLRRTVGIDPATLNRRYGDAVTHALERLQQQGWLEWWQGRLRIPPQRLTVANEVLVEVLRACT